LQIEENINVDEGEKIKENLKNLQFQRKKGDMMVKMHYVGHFIM
jgi:hypothetical protein